MRGPGSQTQGNTMSGGQRLSENDGGLNPYGHLEEPSVMDSQHLPNNDISMVQDQDLQKLIGQFKDQN